MESRSPSVQLNTCNLSVVTTVLPTTGYLIPVPIYLLSLDVDMVALIPIFSN